MLDANGLKDKELKSWTNVVPGWRKYDAFLTRAATPVTERMLQLAAVATGHQVLDIASGVGEPAIPAARKVGPSGRVIGTDFVEEMLALAREKTSSEGLKNIEFRRVDGEALDFPSGHFDAVAIRWGIMFMPAPDACLREAHRVLKVGGRIAVACWAAPDKNPWARIPIDILRRLANAPAPQLGAPNIFAFADDKRLRAILEGVGFRDVVVEAVEITMADFDDANAYFTYVRELAGPVAALYSQLSPAQQEQAFQEVTKQVSPSGGRVTLRGVTWVAAAHK